MVRKKITLAFLTFMCFLLTQNITFGVSPEGSELEKQEFKQERARIKALRKSFKPGRVNDLKEYEKFAGGIQSKWSPRNKEHYARLMLEVCGPLSSGRFNEKRQFVIARKYALLGLKDANEIPLTLELELIRHVRSDMVTPRAPKGQKWEQLRKKDVQKRLHAWKRVIDAIDPNWDPNDTPFINVPPPPGAGGEAGGDPRYIRDPKLRAEYEAAIEKNRQKAQKNSEQRRLRDWLKWFRPKVEKYIVRAYSKPPFNSEELKQYLKDYIADEKTKARIVNTVTKNMGKQTKKTPKD